MEDWRASILEGLRGFEAAASAAGRGGDRSALRASLARLADLERALPADADAQLRHYLQRRSYEKARLWIEGTDPEAGPCPR